MRSLDGRIDYSIMIGSPGALLSSHRIRIRFSLWF